MKDIYFELKQGGFRKLHQECIDSAEDIKPFLEDVVIVSIPRVGDNLHTAHHSVGEFFINRHDRDHPDFKAWQDTVKQPCGICGQL